MPAMSHRHSAVVASLLEQFSHMLAMDHIDIPHIHQYISTARMATPMVLLRRPTHSNTLPIIFTLYLTSTPYRCTWNHSATRSPGITLPLGHLESPATRSPGITPPLGHLESLRD